jgi:hypothetical protein
VLPALLLTLAVEVPLYTAALTVLRLAGPWRAVLLGVLVNLATHPALWLLLAPHPGAAKLWTAEALATAIEAAILIKAINPTCRGAQRPTCREDDGDSASRPTCREEDGDSASRPRSREESGGSASRRGDNVLLVVIAVGANAASLLMGLVVLQ